MLTYYLLGVITGLMPVLARRAWYCGIVGMWVPQSWRKKSQGSPAKPEVAYETYGHPLPPIPELDKALPDPPDNHAWEVVVVPVELKEHHGGAGDASNFSIVGSLALECRLINLLAPDEQRVVDTKRIDLIWNCWYDGFAKGLTWASFYRNRNELQSRELFREDLIGPIIDWAHAHADRMRSYSAGEYLIKGAG